MQLTRLLQLGPWYSISRLLLGGIFIYAGLLKVGASQELADGIAAYRLLPNFVIPCMALGLPLFEIVCGFYVISGIQMTSGALGILIMLVVFTGAITSALIRGITIDCGCFVGHSWFESNLWAALLRNGVLLCLAIFIYRRSVSTISEKPL